MIRKMQIFLAAIVFVLTTNFSFAQYSLPAFDSEDESPLHWTSELLRIYAYYAVISQRTSYSLYALQSPPNDPYYNSSGSWGQSYDDMWGLKRINIENAWKLSTGAGTTIAVLDTGVDYNHSDINSNIWTNIAELNGTAGVDDDGNGYKDDMRGWDFHNNDNNPMDGHGHGTHVSGIAAAEGNNGEGIIGVAYDAKIMPIKVISDSDSAYIDRVAAGIRYAVDMGVKILNCSFSFPYYLDLVNAFKYAYDKGCIIIAAAGNNYSSIDEYPALLDYVITVGSISTSNARSVFSSYGNQLDVVAPGENILSLRAGGTNMRGSSIYLVPQGSASAKYLRADGTSMAAPFVSGLAALMFSQNKNLTFADFKRRLKFSSYDLGTAGWDQYYGWGRMDAFKALSYDWHDSGVVKTWWLTEPDADNVIRYEYDTQHRIIFKHYDDTGIAQYEYWSATGDNIKYFSEFSPGYIWQKTIEYYDNGTTIHKQWVLDQHPGVATGDGIYYEYDTLGKLKLMITDIGEPTAIEEYFPSDNKKIESIYNAGWVWQKAIQYYDTNPSIIHYQWLLDPNPGATGDAVYLEYDTLGNLRLQITDIGEPTAVEEYFASGNKKLESYYNSTWQWQKAIQYYDTNPSVMHYQWLLDQNLDVEGDIVYEEYDATGQWIFRVYDNGSTSQFTGDMEFIDRMDLQSLQLQPGVTSSITFTSEMAIKPPLKK